MEWSKRSVFAGVVFSACAVILTILKRAEFFVRESREPGLFVLALAVAALIFPAASFSWQKKIPSRIYPVLTGILFLCVPLIMLILTERMSGNSITQFTYWENWLDNYLILLLIYTGFYAISGRVRISLMLVTPLLFCFGVACMYVLKLKGSPLVPVDIGSILTALNVAKGFQYPVTGEMILSLNTVILILAIAAHLNRPGTHPGIRLLLRLFALIFVISFTGTFYGTDVFADNGYKPDFFNQTRGYKNHGTVLEFVLNTRYLVLKEPDGYDASEIPALIESGITHPVPDILTTALRRQGDIPESDPEKPVSPEPAEATAKPDLIVIMNESFSDLRCAGFFQTNKPFMPYIDSLIGTENTIEGNAFVSVFGAGTSNTEFEFLTGNPMAALPAGSNAYQLYIKQAQPGLVSSLISQGYTADAYHTYYSSSWNRVAVYDFMGFRRFISIEDLIDPKIIQHYRNSGDNYYTFKRLLREAYPDEDILLRRYVSDSYDYKKLIEMYEARDPEVPFFLFNVTMQDHSSYDRRYDNFDQEIWLTSTRQNYPKANQYLSLIKRSDDAFEELISYFEKVERPVIVLMFGDHQPFVEDEFYEEIMGQSINSLSDAMMQKRYITRFILWANYDIPEGWIDAISVNCLSTLLLQTADLEMPAYGQYIASRYEEIPVLTSAGGIDREGQFFDPDDSHSAWYETVQDYRRIVYNNLAETDQRAGEQFYLQQTTQ